jgi:hypothetical protein
MLRGSHVLALARLTLRGRREISELVGVAGGFWESGIDRFEALVGRAAAALAGSAGAAVEDVEAAVAAGHEHAPCLA